MTTQRLHIYLHRIVAIALAAAVALTAFDADAARRKRRRAKRARPKTTKVVMATPSELQDNPANFSTFFATPIPAMAEDPKPFV